MSTKDKIGGLRRKSGVRVTIIIILLVIVAILFYFWKAARNKQGDIDATELRITYDIINGRYINNLRTIFSSEYTVSEIMKIDEAIGGRIYEMVMPYGVKCEGYNRRIGANKNGL